MSKFVPDLSSIAERIQSFTHKNAEFKWGKEQQVAFEKLKELITHTDALAYFNVNSRTRIVADASPVGLGAVLTQLHGSEWHVIGYASRRLSDVERRYSQTEKDALALVWACERFNMYVFGWEFELETGIISRWSTSIRRNRSPLPVWKDGSFAYRLTNLRLFTDQARPTLQMPCPG